MDPSKRNAAALTKRVNDLTRGIMKHYMSILATAQQPHDVDYSTTAQRELAIKEDTTSFIRAAQDLSSLIRELQELWLFGGLDTLTDPADEEANKAKALGIAAMVEVLAKTKPEPRKNDETNGESSLLAQGYRRPVVPNILISANNPLGPDASLLFRLIYDSPSPEATHKPERKKSQGSPQKTSQKSLLVPATQLQLDEELPETSVEAVQRLCCTSETFDRVCGDRKKLDLVLGFEQLTL